VDLNNADSASDAEGDSSSSSDTIIDMIAEGEVALEVVVDDGATTVAKAEEVSRCCCCMLPIRRDAWPRKTAYTDMLFCWF